MNKFQPFYVEVDGPQHSRMLQEIAFEEGFGWGASGDIKETKHVDSLLLSFSKYGKLFYNNKTTESELTDNKLEDFSLEEFRQALNGNYQWEEPIKIGEYEVEFYDHHIEVECQEFTFEEVETVYHSLSKIYNSVDGLVAFPHHADVGNISFEKVKKIYNRITD